MTKIPMFNFKGKPQHRYLRLSMEKRLWNSAETARFLKISPQLFGLMLNFGHRPRMSPGLEQKLMQLTGKTVDQLWPVTQRERRKKAREVEFVRRLTPEFLEAKGLFQIPPGQEEVLRRRDMRVEVNRRLRVLSPSKARIIREIHLEGGTSSTAARPEWVTRQNANAIGRKAMKELSARAQH